MGKLKVHDWQYRPRNLVTSPHDLGIKSAIFLANEEFNYKKRAREVLAADAVAKEAADELANKYTDWDLGCAALILYRKYGKEATEIAEFLTDVQNLTNEFNSSGVTCESIWDIVEDEVGLAIEREY